MKITDQSMKTLMNLTEGHRPECSVLGHWKLRANLHQMSFTDPVICRCRAPNQTLEYILQDWSDFARQ